MNGLIPEQSWVFWIAVILFVLFLLWLFKGGGDYQYVGVSPLLIGVNSADYVSASTLANLRREGDDVDYPRYNTGGTRSSYSERSSHHRRDRSERGSRRESSGRGSRDRELREQRPRERGSRDVRSREHRARERSRRGAYQNLRPPTEVSFDTTSHQSLSFPSTQDIDEFASTLDDSTSIIDLTPELPAGVEAEINDNTEETMEYNEYIAANGLEPRQNNFRSKGETKCAEVMEKIYGKPFVTVRPNFIKNPATGRNLEIDCYNDELKLGVEYNGVQHYKWPNFTRQTYADFVKQIQRDQMKVDMCDQHGVYLITVPYHVKHEDIESYIRYYLPENVAARLQMEE